jgi:hypothetical protein
MQLHRNRVGFPFNPRYLSGISKDTVRIGVERVLKDLQAKVRGQGKVEMVIPGLGVFNCYDGIAAVAFDGGLIGQSSVTTNKNLTSVGRKRLADNFLTSGKMEKFYLQEVRRD